MTELDQLLTSIDPQKTVEETEARADRAINSFSFNEADATQWDVFRSHLINFMRHIEAALLGARALPEASTDFEWGRCVRLLLQEYGQNGEKAAFELARTGNEGGLYGVLKKLASRVARQYGENEVSARIGRWWDQLSIDEKLAAGDEYIGKWGHLLPSELTEGSAARIRANFPKVLEEHPRLVQRMRRLAR